MLRNNKKNIRSKVFEGSEGGIPDLPGNKVVCHSLEDLRSFLYGTETDETASAIDKAWHHYCNGNYSHAVVTKEPNSDQYKILLGCDENGNGIEQSVAALYDPGHAPTSDDENGAAQIFRVVGYDGDNDIETVDFNNKSNILGEVKTSPQKIEDQGAGVGGKNNIEAVKDSKGTGSESGNNPGSGADKGSDSGADKDSNSGSGDDKTHGEGETPGEGETSGEGNATPSSENTSALVEFFTNPAVLISVAAIAGIITMFAILSKSIKARFRKTAKSLYRLQKDFGGSPEGLDMDNAFKGQGSRITDILVKVFGFGKKGKGAIGLVPFVKNYQDEIKRDYLSAAKSFNMISQAGQDQDKPGAEINPENESLNIPTYKTFREACNARKLNESAYSGEVINESVVATISSAILLGRLAYSAGKFIWSKMGDDGKMEPAQAVQVTKQSTREVCYSIMNCFFAKYFNMEGVSTKLGLDVNHLSDIDKSNVDKFKKLVVSMKMEQKDNARVSKMYSRVQKQYNEMLKRYFTIANKVVDNFEKYSKRDKNGKAKQLSEKEDNMLTSGVEKLRMELSRQRDLYENNFFRVVNAIVASPEYIQYIDFIIENVIPVFETGNAGDADYVLNTMPRKNEYFLVRQTRNTTEIPNPDTIDMRNGNVALVMVEEVNTGENKGAPIVKFKRVGLFKSKEGDGEVKIQEDGTVDYETIDKDRIELDTKAYAKDVDGKEEGESQSLVYTKWIALDPIQVVNYAKEGDDNNDEDTVVDDSTIVGMRRNINGTEEMVFIIPEQPENGEDTETPHTNSGDQTPTGESADKDKQFSPDLAVNEDGQEEGDEKQEKVDRIEFVTTDENKAKIVNTIHITSDELTKEAVVNLLANMENKDLSFTAMNDNDTTNSRKTKVEGNNNTSESSASTKEELLDIINGKKKSDNTIDSDEQKDLSKVFEALNEHYRNIEFSSKTFDIIPDKGYVKVLEKVTPSIITFKTQIPNLSLRTRLLANINLNEVNKFIQEYIQNKGKGNTTAGGQTSLPKQTQQNLLQLPAAKGFQEGIVIKKRMKINEEGEAANGSNLPVNQNSQVPAQQGQQSQQSQQGQQQNIGFNALSVEELVKCINLVNNFAVPETDGKLYASWDDEKKEFNVYKKILKLVEIEIFNTDTSTEKLLASEVAQFTEESITNAVENLVNKFKTVESFNNIKFDVNYNISTINESVNSISLHRNIKQTKNNISESLYIVSAYAWGDGSSLYPAKSVEDTITNMLESAKDYYDIAVIAKRDRTIKLVPVSESLAYNITMPHNRYAMLTAGNPLYEAAAIFTVDNSIEHKILASKFIGVTRIIK